jgi:hypothetical protein
MEWRPARIGTSWRRGTTGFIGSFHKMKRGLFLMTFAAIAAALPRAHAEDVTALETLKNELEHKLPSTWQMHVRWRDGALLASFMPPYQEAFDLWYRPTDLLEKMSALCPGPDAGIWRLLRADEDIVLEPTVGGKTTLEMRLSCRKQLLDR